MIRLSEGSGGKEMVELIKRMTSFFPKDRRWAHTDNDAAVWKAGENYLMFTTDSFVVDPIFFPGGDIGKVAMCGTINDLAVMGGLPAGISLGIVLEEGFSKKKLDRIISSIGKVSEETGVPVVTGDTKVVEKGKVDKIIINTAGIGACQNVLDKPVSPGDKVIVSGSIGEHAVAVLSRRFDFETSTITDCKPLIEEVKAVKGFIKQAKDLTRGGIAAALNEICEKGYVSMLIDAEKIPVKREVKAVTDLLGIDLYSLACEGRLVCVASPENALRAVDVLRRFNPEAAIIGEVTGRTGKSGGEVVVETGFGKRVLPMPSGNIVPRIC